MLAVTLAIIILPMVYVWSWFLIFLWIIAWGTLSMIPDEVPLKIILKAAMVVHVRLCLNRIYETNRWRYISQSAPNAKMDYWSDDQLLGKHFVYMAPGWNVRPLFIKGMIIYAEAHIADRGKRGYDYLQSFSIYLNSILFWWIPAFHGKEIIKFMNLPGFKEVCSTLVAAILRWAKLYELIIDEGLGKRPLSDNELNEYIDSYYQDHQGHLKEFFEGYDTSMVSPCLYVIKAYLKEKWILPESWQK